MAAIAPETWTAVLCEGGDIFEIVMARDCCLIDRAEETTYILRGVSMNSSLYGSRCHCFLLTYAGIRS